MNEHISAILSCRIPLALKEQLQEFKTRYHLRTETRAVVELLTVGLLVDRLKANLQEPAIVQFLRSHLYDEMLVDFVYSLSPDRLDALLAVFTSARDLRIRDSLKG